MPYDRELADKIACGTDDRDRALFFAGREVEIKTFENALTQASGKPQAVFRVYQGPPGCGKTSLAAHLEETRADRTLFVRCGVEDFESRKTLAECIYTAAIDKRGFLAQAGAAAARAASARFSVAESADPILQALARRTQKDATLVLHLDEAHGRAAECAALLRELHAVGARVPCVVLLTGLPRTHDVVTAIEGLTRLARDAVHDVDELPAKACAESTRAMLDALNVDGTERERDMLADLTAELAHGWPQHLNGAQAALCVEFVRADGRVRDVNTAAVRERSDAARANYYAARLADHDAFGVDPAVTRSILVDVAAHAPRTRIGLRKLCAAAFSRERLTNDLAAFGVTPTVMANALLDKGVVVDRGSKGLGPAIPSMVDWARGDLPPQADDPAGGRGGR